MREIYYNYNELKKDINNLKDVTINITEDFELSMMKLSREAYKRTKRIMQENNIKTNIVHHEKFNKNDSILYYEGSLKLRSKKIK